MQRRFPSAHRSSARASSRISAPVSLAPSAPSLVDYSGHKIATLHGGVTLESGPYTTDSANGNPGRLRTGDHMPLLVPSPWGSAFGNAYQFDGIDRGTPDANCTVNCGVICRSGPRTLEGKVKRLRSGQIEVFAGEHNGTAQPGTYVFFFTSTDLKLHLEVIDGSLNVYEMQSTTDVAVGSLSEVAFCYDGTAAYLLLKGHVEATQAVASIPKQDNPLRLGGYDNVAGVYSAKIVMDDWRLSRIARHTTDYTPAAGPLSVDADTIYLYHFDDRVEGPRNNFSFDGTGYVDLGTGLLGGAATNGPFTVQGRFRRRVEGYTQPEIIFGRVSASISDLDIYIAGGGGATDRLRVFYLDSALGGHVMDSASDVRSGVLTQFAVTYDGTTWRTYINGVREVEQVQTRLASTPGIPMTIGADSEGAGNSGSYFFFGTVEEMEVSDIARYTAATYVVPATFTADLHTQFLGKFDSVY